MKSKSHPDPKGQHIVPSAFLKRFADGDGKLFWCRVEDRKVRHQKPAEILKKRDAYVLIEKDGSKDYSIEHFFSKIENNFNPIIEKAILHIRRWERKPLLSRSERVLLIHCLANICTRDPRFFSDYGNNDFWESNVDEVIGHLNPTQAERKRSQQNLKAQTFAASPDTMIELMLSTGLNFLLLKNTPPLIVGNQIYVGDSTSNMPWIPVAHDALLAFGGRAGSLQFDLLTKSASVRQLNKQIAKRSYLIAGKCESDIKALAQHLSDKPRNEIVV